MENVVKIDFCPLCGNQTPKRLIHTQFYENMGYVSSEGDDEFGSEYPFKSADYVAVCQVCNQLLIYTRTYYPTDDEEEFLDSERIYPNTEIDKSIPENIRRIYEEALRIENQSPNSFAVQIRRALEAICKDQGVTSGPLYKRLKKLSDQGTIPSVLGEASDLLRLLGNVGAHSIDRGVHPLEIISIKDFFKAIIEYLYIYPNKINNFKKNYEVFRRWSQEQSEEYKEFDE